MLFSLAERLCNEEVDNIDLGRILFFLREIELLGKLKAIAPYYTAIDRYVTRDHTLEVIYDHLQRHVWDILYELAKLERLDQYEESAFNLSDDLEKLFKEEEEKAPTGKPECTHVTA